MSRLHFAGSFFVRRTCFVDCRNAFSLSLVTFQVVRREPS